MTRITSRPCRVLVAEETADLRTLLVRLLQAAGYETLEAEHGGAALRLLHEGRADAALLAQRLPGLRGPEVVREARKFAPALPLLVFTDLGSIRAAVEAVKLGADDYLVLPVRIEELARTLEDALATRPVLAAPLLLEQWSEALARLAGATAHDLNEQLTVILGYGELLLERLKTAAPSHPELQLVHAAAERAAALIRRLALVSRPGQPAVTVFDLDALLAGLDSMLRRLLGEKVDLALLLTTTPAPVRADPQQVELLLLNLAINARTVLPPGARLTVEVAAMAGPASGGAGQGAPPGDYIVLRVQFPEGGPDAEGLARLFDPFLSRPPGPAEPGPAGVWEFVRQTGGGFTATATPGQGVTLTLCLPRAHGAETSSMSPAPLAPVPGGSETVLVLEEGTQLRALLSAILRQRGYTVLEAATADDALTAFQQAPGPVHLLVAEAGPPGAMLLAGTRPGLKVLYVSDRPADELERQGLLPQGSAFLQKPFGADALLRQVRAVLNGGLPPRT